MSPGRRTLLPDLVRARRGGYTLIEVMVAIAISAIGVSGIVFMQQATVVSNQDAHETQIATIFARTWIERMKRDALLWTEAGPPPVGAMFAGRVEVANPATYFVPTAANTDVGAWTVPIPMGPPATESSGANYHGVDVGARDLAINGAPVVSNADIYYCANTKFVTVHTVNNLPNAIRATVRVWWIRRSSLNTTSYRGILAVRAGGCQAFVPSSPALQDAGQGRFRVTYLSTILRWTAPT
jgi:prepilin-type N-terminal cleavage/methylation domain-containing protein